jgi:hypothetical protein
LRGASENYRECGAAISHFQDGFHERTYDFVQVHPSSPSGLQVETQSPSSYIRPADNPFLDVELLYEGAITRHGNVGPVP